MSKDTMAADDVIDLLDDSQDQSASKREPKRQKLLADSDDDVLDDWASLDVEQLESKIHAAAEAYYNTGSPIMSDAAFDALSEELQRRAPESAVLTEVGAPVGGPKVKLPYQMMSLDKVKEGTAKWAAKHPGPYAVSDKLDGTSAMFAHDRLYRRGTGEIGADISHLIPALIPAAARGTALVVRGEVILKKCDFDPATAVDARSAVNGLVNRRAADASGASGSGRAALEKARFVAYEVVRPRMEKARQFEALRKAGFETAWESELAELSDDALAALFSRRREESPYAVDGIVVQAAGVHDPDPGRNPTYAFAFKAVLADQGRATTVLDVVYKQSRDGRLVPRVSFEPVTLASGVTLKWASGHNARFVEANAIGPGARIVVVRSGDVIPKIVSVERPAASPQLPDADPAWEWDATRVHAMVNELGDVGKVKLLLKFLSALGVEHVKETSLTKLYGAGLDTVPKLVQATRAALAAAGLGDAAAAKFAASLEAGVRGADTVALMVASNAFGTGVGAKRLRVLANAEPGFETLEGSALRAAVLRAPGFQEVMATKIVEGMPRFHAFVASLGITLAPAQPRAAPAGQPTMKDLLSGKAAKASGKQKGIPAAPAAADVKKIVFSGFRDAQLEKVAIAAGYDVVGSVSSKTHAVVTKDPESTTGKVDKARQLGVAILKVTEFRSRLARALEPVRA